MGAPARRTSSATGSRTPTAPSALNHRLPSEIRCQYVAIVDEVARRRRVCDHAVLQHVGVIGDGRRHPDVLLDEQNRQPSRPEISDRLDNGLDDERRQTDTRWGSAPIGS